MILFYLAELLLMPVIMAGLGFLWKNHAPRTINSFYGYRTKRSMKSPAAWEFAHRYAGRAWLYASLPAAAIPLTVLYLYRNAGKDAMAFAAIGGMVVQLALLLLAIPLTERQLKRQFDQYGRKRNPQD
ncbi:SdpI family protein [Bacilliculturomica massiliensis]|uniref:SdpI family protein n=1 Tax=Bacilliculturomica massiliensis TaxID=1917867 RepID=UPI00102F7B23|nr:SdpI family protein [Bacilliculturomica massiliensis]